jgi:predicted transcriptional regulator
MRLEKKVLEFLKTKASSAADIGVEIMVSPKKVLRAIEKLEKAGILMCESENHDIHTVHRYKS